MFKRKMPTKAIDLNNDIQGIEVDHRLLEGANKKKQLGGNKSENREQKGEQIKKATRYGLIEKESKEVKQEQKPKEQNFFVYLVE